MTSFPHITRQPSSSSFANLNKPKVIAEGPDFPPVYRTTHLIFGPPQSSKLSFRRALTPRPFSIEITEDTENESAEEAIETGLGGRHRYGLSAIEGNQTIDSRIRFHGRSSTASLVEVTRTFKQMYIQEGVMQNSLGDQGKDTFKESARHKATLEKPDNAELRVFRRPEFWSIAKVRMDLFNCHPI